MSVNATRKRLPTAGPSGRDSLDVRERFLKSRRTRQVGDRSLVAMWITVGAVFCWIFVAGFAGLGH